MRKLFPIALCIVAGSGLNMPAQAQPTPPGPLSGSDAPDRMARPAPTRKDAERKAEEQFAAIDRNHDGVVTRDEIAASQRVERDRMHAFIEAQMKAHRDRLFDRLDTNKDGSISRAEFAAAESPPPPGMAGPSGPPPQGGGSGWRGPMEGHRIADGLAPAGRGAFDRSMPHARMLGEGWFERADADHDDKVTLAEAKASALARFDRLDSNHDGTIEPEERRMAFRGAWRDRRVAPTPPGAMPPSHG